MTEREIPDGLSGVLGGMPDALIPPSAPPAPSAPENALAAAPAPVGEPRYASRREARASGGFSMDAASATTAPTPAETPAAPSYDGIASLFPLLGEVTASPLTTEAVPPSTFDAVLAAPLAQAPAQAPAEAPAELAATQAIPAVEIAAELATPVARYVVPQSGPVAIAPTWNAPMPAAPGADPFGAPRRGHAAPARPPARSGSPRSRTHSRSGGRTVGRAVATRRRAAPGAVGVDVKPLRQRLFGVGAMVLVGGLFAVLAIPAYAHNDATTLTAAAAVQTQKVAVENAAASTVSTAARDGYTATSAEDLKSLYAAAMREQNIQAYLQSGAKAKGDDYPWYAELSRNQGGGLSPLGYYYRECVDFVAWRLNRDVGSTSAPFRWTWSRLTPNGGDGRQWKSAWLAHGWPTGTTPMPGAVAWFGDNHVAYVNGILDNGQVLIEEYNWTPHAYSTRVINASDAYYLYAPPT